MTEATTATDEPLDLREEIRDLIRDNALFHSFTANQIDQLVSIIGHPKAVKAGDIVVNEGDPPDNVYIVRSGTVEVLKGAIGVETTYRIAELGVGDTIGEVSLLDSGPRSATVRALEDVSLLAIPIDEINALSQSEVSIDTRMKINLAYELGHRLRSSNEATVRNLREKLAEAETRAEMGKFMSRVLIGTCLYMFALGLTSILARTLPDTTWISAPILLGFAIGLFLTIKTSVYPLSAYGLTTENWRWAVKESLIYTVLLLVAIVAVKAAVVSMVPSLQGTPVFDLYRSRHTTVGMALLAAFVYSLFVPLQEGVARCGLQSSFQMFLTGRFRILWSICLSNMLFSATHIHVSVLLALAVFPVGLLWGWLYYRHKTIIGILVSHIIVGLFTLFIVGIPK